MKQKHKEALGYLLYRLGSYSANVSKPAEMHRKLKRGAYFAQKFSKATRGRLWGPAIPFSVLTLEQIQYCIKILKSHGVDTDILADIMQRWGGIVDDSKRFYFLNGDN